MKFFQDQARRLFTMVGLIVAAVVVYYLGWLKPIEHAVSLAAQPALGLAYATIDSFSPLYSTTDSTLLSENRTLKDQLASVIEQNRQLQVNVQQLQDYQAEIEFAQKKSYTIQPAKVIARLGDAAIGQWLYIQLGESDGIEVGYPVIYGPGMMLGVVEAVHESYSEVKLITNDDSFIQGQTQTDAATAGVLTGQFGTSLLMQYIIKEQAIAEGDVIITNGQDRFIPAGLIIGTVETVTEETSNLFKSASITPMVRYGNNAIVSIVIPNAL